MGAGVLPLRPIDLGGAFRSDLQRMQRSFTASTAASHNSTCPPANVTIARPSESVAQNRSTKKRLNVGLVMTIGRHITTDFGQQRRDFWQSPGNAISQSLHPRYQANPACREWIPYRSKQPSARIVQGQVHNRRLEIVNQNGMFAIIAI